MPIAIEDLIKSINQSTGIPINRIHQDSKLIRDLAIEGEDGYILMNDISIAYDIDLSHYDFYQYFGHEPQFTDIVAGVIINFFALLRLCKRPAYPDLTVEELYQIILTAPSTPK